MGHTCSKKNDLKDALGLYKRAFKIKWKVLGSDHPETMQVYLKFQNVRKLFEERTSSNTTIYDNIENYYETQQQKLPPSSKQVIDTLVMTDTGGRSKRLKRQQQLPSPSKQVTDTLVMTDIGGRSKRLSRIDQERLKGRLKVRT